jgi:PEP-CTERM motif
MKTSVKNRNRKLLGSVAAMGMAGLVSASAQAIYTIVPSATTLDWNTDTNWTSLLAGGYPGISPGDSAIVSGAFGGQNQTVDISLPLLNGISSLTMGDTSGVGKTTIQSEFGSSLMFVGGATISSLGTGGAINEISAPVRFSGDGDLTIAGAPEEDPAPPGAPVASTNGLSITGKITGGNAHRKIINASGHTLDLGDIDFAANTSGRTFQFLNEGNASSQIRLNGVISNSGTGALSHVTLAEGGTFVISGFNTYTGNTALGTTKSYAVTYYINSDQAFGVRDSGTLSINTNNANGVHTFEAMNADRAIVKDLQVGVNARTIFQGEHSLSIDTQEFVLGRKEAEFINNITAEGKSVTLGRQGGKFYLTNDATDSRSRVFTGAGRTVVLSDIIATTGGTTPVESVTGLNMAGANGTLVLTGTNTYQGPTRITADGATVQLGNNTATGSLESGNGLTPVVTSSAAGFLAIDRSNDYNASFVANGSLGIVQKGTGTVTLANSQFNTGANTIGGGANLSRLVVTGSILPSVNPTSAVEVQAVGSYRTLTLSGSDTIASLNLKVGQPVYIGIASANAYIHSIDSVTGVITVYGTNLSSITAGSHTDLTFGAGSALGTGATTVKNNGILAGNGQIAGTVTGETGSRIAPGMNPNGYSGAVGTLTTGALTLNNDSIVLFDLAATAAGTSDLISTNDQALLMGAVNFTFYGLTPGAIETGAFYSLINAGSGTFTGDTSAFTSTFTGDLFSLYTATYSMQNIGGDNIVGVTFAAVPEPGTMGLLGLAGGIGIFLIIRRRRSVS